MNELYENSNKNEDIKPKGLFWLLIVVLLIVFSIAVMFFNRNNGYDLSSVGNLIDDNKQNKQDSRIYSVTYRNGTFSPTNIRIRSGDTVRIENNGLFSIHIISDDLTGFDSLGDIPPSGVFTFTFSKEGIFSYYNYKSIEETGTVIVR